MKPTRFTRLLRYSNWIFNPAHGLSTSQVYDLIDKSSPTENGLYLNLGYWRDASTMDDASDALALLVAEAGGMDESDHVLDCGFGFGDQDMLWARRIGPHRITGLNITQSQVDTAQARVTAAGLEDRIDLRQGSATDIPLEDDSVDLVVSLESAFHYRTREDFFRESMRVLRPGGRLVTADILPMPIGGNRRNRRNQRIGWWVVASKFLIPAENVYDIDSYGQRLNRAGFDIDRLESIRNDVYAPLHRHMQAHPERLAVLHPIARLPARLSLKWPPEDVYPGLDYILAVGRKPG
ncbi:MAG: methyltransferase domain-containing protein [Pseudomonadota bacterium]